MLFFKKFMLLVILTLSSESMADELKGKFEIYGFLQADYIQHFKRVNPFWDTTLRPSKIPTQDGLYGSDGQAIISVNQSRFGVKGDLPTEGQNLHTLFEFDMFGVGVDEGQTTIRLRHSFGEYRNWLAGQTHSLFMDIDVFPRIIDYAGPNGMAFLRNPQIRYTFLKGENEVAIAIEKPSNDIDSNAFKTIGDELGVNFQSDEKFPDLTFLTKKKGPWGYLQVSGVLRSIGIETTGGTTNEPKDRLIGWGMNLSSNINLSVKNRILLSTVYGNGIASYMNDGGTDVGPKGTSRNPHAKLIPLLGLVAFYNHYWNEKFSSSMGYSITQVDNSILQSGHAFKKGEYALSNLLYAPVKNFLVGGELLWGSRTDKDGAYGDDVVTEISFKYSFSSFDFP